MASRPKRASTSKADNSNMLGLSRQEERMLQRAMYDSLKEKTKLPQQLNSGLPSPVSIQIPSDNDSIYKPKQVIPPAKQQRGKFQRSIITRSKSVTSKYRQIRLKNQRKDFNAPTKKLVNKTKIPRFPTKDTRNLKGREPKSVLQEGKRYSPMRRLPLQEMLKSLEDRKTHIVESGTNAVPMSTTSMYFSSILKRPASSSPARKKKKVAAITDKTNLSTSIKPKPVPQVQPIPRAQLKSSNNKSIPKRRVGRPSANKTGDKKLIDQPSDKVNTSNVEGGKLKPVQNNPGKNKAAPLYSASISTRQHSSSRSKINVSPSSKRVTLARKLARQSRQSVLKTGDDEKQRVKKSALATKKKSVSLMARSMRIKSKPLSTSTPVKSSKRPPTLPSNTPIISLITPPASQESQPSFTTPSTSTSPINNRQKKKHYLLYHPRRIMIPTTNPKLPRYTAPTSANTNAQSKIISSSQRASSALLASSKKRAQSTYTVNSVPPELWLDPRGNPVKTDDFLDFLLFRESPNLLENRLKWFHVPPQKRKQKHFRVSARRAASLNNNKKASLSSAFAYQTNVTVEKANTSSIKRTTFVNCSQIPRLTENPSDSLPVVCTPTKVAHQNAELEATNTQQDGVKKSAASVVSSSCPTQAAVDESLIMLSAAPSMVTNANAVDTRISNGDINENSECNGAGNLPNGNHSTTSLNNDTHELIISPRSVHTMTTRHRRSA